MPRDYGMTWSDTLLSLSLSFRMSKGCCKSPFLNTEWGINKPLLYCLSTSQGCYDYTKTLAEMRVAGTSVAYGIFRWSPIFLAQVGWYDKFWPMCYKQKCCFSCVGQNIEKYVSSKAGMAASQGMCLVRIMESSSDCDLWANVEASPQQTCIRYDIWQKIKL